MEIEPGIAVLFADQPPIDFDLVPFQMLHVEGRKNLIDKLAIALGIGNMAAQGAQGAINAQGLVRLAPETVEALKTFKPMTSGGWNLGSIVTDKGSIVTPIRWGPATGVQSVTMLSALGPAAATLALQVQLASISRRLDENIELTRDVRRVLDWSETLEES